MTRSVVWLLALPLTVACGPKTVPPAAPVETAPAPAPASPATDAWGAPPADAAAAAAAGAATLAAQATGVAPADEAAPSALTPAGQRQLADAAAMISTGDAAKAQQAAERLRALIAERPDVAALHYNLGNAELVAGRTEEARRAWIRATEVDPAYAKAWVNLGVLNARNGRADLALASYQSGLRYAPDALELHVAIIAAQRELERPEEAVAQARTALKINSKAIDVYNQLALVYLDTGQLDLARFVLEKAQAEIDGAKGNAQLYASLGQVYYRQGYAGNALESFKRALEIDPLQVTALQFLASYHLDNRAYADAAPLWERVCGLLPAEAGPRINLGIAYRGLGRYEEAKRAYEEAMRLDPKNPEPLRNLGVLYGDYMKAYDAAVQAVEDYRRAGGGPAAELDAWVASIRKEQDKARRMEERRRKEEERKRAEEAAAQPAPAPQPAPEPAPQPTPQPAPQPQPAPESNDPWGGGGAG